MSYAAIERAQDAAVGHTEPLSVNSPADTLRRRLMIDRDLPKSSPVSTSAVDAEPIEQWPDATYLEPEGDDRSEFAKRWDTSTTLELSLVDALQISAYESREYRLRKEGVYEAALALDLERDQFRNTWGGVVDSLVAWDLEQEFPVGDRGRTISESVVQNRTGGSVSLSRQLANGIGFTGLLGLDLVSLLTQEKTFSRGVFADITMTIPLMRGSGEFVVREPLRQAERDVVYAIYGLERFKRVFAVDVASEYLNVLRLEDAVRNSEENYRSLIASSRRARRLADAGRLPEFQVDQAKQDELRARNNWVRAVETHTRALDAFKLTLGLPTDAELHLLRSELEGLRGTFAGIIDAARRAGRAAVDESEEPAPADAPVSFPEVGTGSQGTYELDSTEAVLLALERRLDLRTQVGEVFDTQRRVAVAADQLRADLTLLGAGSTGAARALGQSGLENANLRPQEGSYSALLTLNLPTERTFERNVYRTTLIRFEQAARDVQALEDTIKLDVRNGLSRLIESRESIQIQARAVALAEQRVESTNVFLDAGRAQIRDLLEAQEALLGAQNALTAALVAYRINELALQRDLGVLEIDRTGLWTEYTP